MKIPASCADLDLALVERTLTRHYGDVTGAARELGVPGPDLKRLTWSKPKLLEAANEECELFVIRAWAVMIEALDSDDLRRQMWAADKIMSSWIARGHPLAPAPRRAAATDVSLQSNKTINYTFRWCADDDDKRDAERAEAERLRDAGKPVVSIGWGDGGRTSEDHAGPEPLDKA